jgi:hypothetical protein
MTERRHLRLVTVAEPLPECRLCERPTLRKAHEANGGLCTDCHDRIADIAKGLP